MTKRQAARALAFGYILAAAGPGGRYIAEHNFSITSDVGLIAFSLATQMILGWLVFDLSWVARKRNTSVSSPESTVNREVAG
jgi:hypothetical protein